MKPSPFTYHRPGSLDEALSLLAGLGTHAKVMAGGQSLLPILSMRLAAPEHLIDLNRLHELDYLRTGLDGVHVGALARHTTVELDAAAAEVQPLLRQALTLVAHPTIRNRGTTVGSLAHADPSGELTAVLALTGGGVTLAADGGQLRTVPAAEFFVAPLQSAIGPTEIAVEAFFPALPAGTGTAFVEVSRRNGDYAVCGVAAAVTVDDGRISSARTGYISVAPTPVVLDLTEAAPDPPSADRARWDGAGQKAQAALTPDSDLHASAEYRSHLVRVLTGRALAAATARALDTRPDNTQPDNTQPADGQEAR